MSSVIIKGDTSGQIALSAPAVAGTNTLTLPTITGTVGVLVSGTAVASTSGTSIDFTGIPAGVRRITVMLNGVSTNGTSNFQIQIGAGSVTTSGYVGGVQISSVALSVTTGFGVTYNNTAATATTGSYVINLFTGNTWIFSGMNYRNSDNGVSLSSGVSPTLGGTLDRIRITTVNGTDTFDAGSINILYE
jgi:hypothetical protein